MEELIEEISCTSEPLASLHARMVDLEGKRILKINLTINDPPDNQVH